MPLLFKRFKDWATSITAFRTGDVIAVDGPSGTAKMSKDTLLAIAANYINTGKGDAFSSSTLTGIITSDASNTASISIGGTTASIDLNKTTESGYVGVTAQLASDSSTIKDNKLFFKFVNSSASPCTFQVLLIKDIYSWETQAGARNVTIEGNGTAIVDYDFSQYASTFSTNSVYLCVRYQGSGAQHVTISCSGYSFVIGDVPNVGKAYDSHRFNGKDIAEFNDTYVQKSEIGKTDTFTSGTLTGVITNDAQTNPVSAGASGHIVYIDMNKTTESGYVGATAQLASNATTIKDCRFVFKINNTSASSGTFTILLLKERYSWGGAVAGAREVTIEGNGTAIVDYDFSQYASTFSTNSVYVCVRVSDTSIQHLTLTLRGYTFANNEIPDVGKAYDTFRFNGRTYEETDAEIGSKKFKPKELFENECYYIYSTGNSVAAHVSNGIAYSTTTLGSSGYVGFSIKITDNAQDLKAIENSTLIIRNVGNDTTIKVYAVSQKYSWGSAAIGLGTYAIKAGNSKTINLKLAEYADTLGSGFAGIALQFTNINTTSKVEVELAQESSLINPVSYSLDTSMVDGKPISEYVGGKYITCWGDSLTAQGGWTTQLATLTGRSVFNCGVGGENSKVIMARQGGNVMMVLSDEMPNVVIPATTDAVAITTGNNIHTFMGYDVRPLQQSGGEVNPVTLDGIKGTLSYSSSKFYFTRSEAGTAKTIDRDARIVTHGDEKYNSPYLMIIFMGQNGGWSDVDELIDQHKKMIAHANAKHVLVLGLSSGTADSRADYEAAMKAEFGRYFVSIRQYLAHPIYDAGNNIVSCYGLADEGLTPTADDLEKIAVGQVPSQLLADSVHYTNATKTAIGNMLFKYCQDLGIF